MAEVQEQPAVTVPLGFYAPQGLAERLREAAREQDRSMSSLIRRALEHELRREPEAVES
jgi:predicted transcriptional regulator